MSKKYHLFEVFGIELEYMVVATSALKVMPVVDKLLMLKNNGVIDDVENGTIAWSNELVGHVIELKTNGPSADLNNLSEAFHKNVQEINLLLKPLEAQLLPTASHPLMNPATDTQLWKHSYSNVYALYNRVFNCSGHGWSNVQSTHINLPFYNAMEFERLHAAIRIILPLIPGLCASSPLMEGKKTGVLDTRLEYYKTNQKEIPEMTGLVIPEQVFTKEAYEQVIFNPINKAIKPYDTEHILDHYFLNSRGAIARFDRHAIEIRLVDIQECPKADIAVCLLIIEVLKLLVNEALTTLENQKSWTKEALYELLNPIIKEGESHQITNEAFLKIFNLNTTASVKTIWQTLYNLVKHTIAKPYQEAIEVILTHGSLSTRILKAINQDFSEKNIKSVYGELANCLQENKLFIA